MAAAEEGEDSYWETGRVAVRGPPGPARIRASGWCLEQEGMYERWDSPWCLLVVDAKFLYGYRY